jgi:hypothetical protein
MASSSSKVTDDAADAAVTTILQSSLRLRPTFSRLYVLYDRDSPASSALADAYIRADLRGLVAESRVADFAEWERHYGADDVGAAIQQDMFQFLRPDDAAVLVQSNAFRIDTYRFRLRLFEKGIRTAEHAHLGLNAAEQTLPYLEACAVPPVQMAVEAAELKRAFDGAHTVCVVTHGPLGPLAEPSSLVYTPQLAVAAAAAAASTDSPVAAAAPSVTAPRTGASARDDSARRALEPSLLNTGYYPVSFFPPGGLPPAPAAASGAPTDAPAAADLGATPSGPAESVGAFAAGGQLATATRLGGGYPVGEVFTEARDLQSVSGVCWVNGYPGLDRVVRACAPFAIRICDGRVTEISQDAPAEFRAVMKAVFVDEGELYVRELGIGLNPAMSMQPHRFVNGLLAFERMRGVHLSVGRKHTVFVKSGVSRKQAQARYHIDIFLAASAVEIDGNTAISF